MLDTTKKLIDDYYKLIITSQKLIAHIAQNEIISSKNDYDEYFNINSLLHFIHIDSLILYRSYTAIYFYTDWTISSSLDLFY